MMYYAPNALLDQEGAAVHNNYAVFNECIFDSNMAHAEHFNGLFHSSVPKGSAVFADANSRTFF